MSIGELIKTAREKAGLTQSALGEKIGVTGVTIMRYEKSLRQIRINQFQRIAAALGLEMWELLGEKEPDPVFERIAKTFPKAPITETDGKISVQLIDPITGPNTFTAEEFRRHTLDAAYNSMNEDGQNKVIEYAQDLTKIPQYQRQPAETAPKSTETPLKEKDTTPDETPTEMPQNPPEDET